MTIDIKIPYSDPNQYVINGVARIYRDDLSRDIMQIYGAGNSLHWARYDTKGNRINHGTGHFTTPTSEELATFDCIAKALVPLRVDFGPRYIRFGRLPRGSRSKNHATGQLEKGVSCYEANYNHATKAWELAGYGLGAAAIKGALGGYDSVWLLEGEEVGRGSDDEPVIAQIKTVARLQYDRTAGGYKEATK